MDNNHTYDVLVIGGGLAGLSLATLLGRKGYSVLVLEKDSYPKHKVCGEYITMQSKPFLEELGISIATLQLPVIDNLHVTDTKGNEVKTQLPYGGFGISRYKLDGELAALAQQAGVTLLTKSRADHVAFESGQFTVQATGKAYQAKVAIGSWGKRSNIDIKWQRNFTKEKHSALNNYMGIKYHIQGPWEKDVVGLHNFTNGYCGISPIENDTYCLCYLSTAEALRSHGNDLKKMESAVLMRNTWLAEIFSTSTFLYDAPLAISQISFERKEQVHDHVLLLGDAAGMITPLCGNGMAMALHSAKIATTYVDRFLQGHISRDSMENGYYKQWEHSFARRTKIGRVVQNNFGKDKTTALFLKTMKHMPFLQRTLISRISGKPF
jgi:flavin-dependent dehydrogenase